MSGSKQEITFQATPEEARVEVVDAVGISYGSCITPCKLDLKRKEKYKVVFSKPGYDTVRVAIDHRTNGWIWGNILLGGVIGLVIDFTSGSAYKLSPRDVSATLSETTVSKLPELDEGLVIIDIDHLTDEERGRLTKLESFEISSSK
jgi:hypothetical protein